MQIKIVGIVIAVPPLKSPAYLYRWFLAWKRNEIMGPGFRHLEKAMREATAAIKGFAKAMKEANIEEEGGDVE